MKNNIEILKNNILFKNFDNSSIESLLTCLSAKKYKYDKNYFIINAGDKINNIGIIIEGKVAVIKEDINGNRNIITELSQSEMFGEAFDCSNINKSSVSIQAISDCEILFIDYNKIINTCSSACKFHIKLINNMLGVLSSKILFLNEKIDIISKRTLREKLLMYLETQSKKQGSKSFVIKMNRQELSDFLFVDRSALSRELCKMRDDGLINFNKNQFELLQ